MRGLGPLQRLALEVMEDHGGFRGWFAGCGWVLDNDSGTDRVMRSLVRRGLVRMTHDNYRGSGYGRFELVVEEG